jgi:hypothetical protein
MVAMVSSGAEGSSPDGRPYPGAWVAAAVVATLFFPVISLIVALVLLGQEREPSRRRSLRTWALASGGFLALQILIGIILLASVSQGSGGGADPGGECRGGVRTDVSAPERPDGTAVFPCEFGGSVTIDFSDEADETP